MKYESIEIKGQEVPLQGQTDEGHRGRRDKHRDKHEGARDGVVQALALGAKHYTQEVAKVNVHWKMPLTIHREIPVDKIATIHRMNQICRRNKRLAIKLLFECAEGMNNHSFILLLLAVMS